MTANAGKGAKGRPGQRSTGAGGKDEQRKTSNAAKSPRDEVTVKKTDDAAKGGGRPADKPDKADETVVDLELKKVGTEDTVQDLKLPDKKRPAAPTGDAKGSKDRLVSRGPKTGDASTTGASGSASGAASSAADSSGGSSGGAPGGKPDRGEPTTRSDGSRPADRTRPVGGYGSSDGSTSSGPSSSYGTVTTPSYGSARPAAALEPASPRPGGDSTRPDRSAAPRKAPRKAHLQVARFEPWSVMKFSFIMSLVCFLVLFVAVVVLYVILSGLGVFTALTHTIQDLQGKSTGGLNPASWFSAGRILGYTALIGTLNVLLITALATVWSVIYNMASDLVGGVEVTLKEADQ